MAASSGRYGIVLNTTPTNEAGAYSRCEEPSGESLADGTPRLTTTEKLERNTNRALM
jgi:hypothetical protein